MDLRKEIADLKSVDLHHKILDLHLQHSVEIAESKAGLTHSQTRLTDLEAIVDGNRILTHDRLANLKQYVERTRFPDTSADFVEVGPAKDHEQDVSSQARQHVAFNSEMPTLTPRSMFRTLSPSLSLPLPLPLDFRGSKN